MTVIWKYELGKEVTHLEMPPQAHVLTAQLQGGRVVIWARITWSSGTVPTARERRTFVIRATGQGYTPDANDFEDYVATVQAFDGALVWHVFEVMP